jgi:hypothetical protein
MQFWTHKFTSEKKNKTLAKQEFKTNLKIKHRISLLEEKRMETFEDQAIVPGREVTSLN